MLTGLKFLDSELILIRLFLTYKFGKDEVTEVVTLIVVFESPFDDFFEECFDWLFISG